MYIYVQISIHTCMYMRLKFPLNLNFILKVIVKLWFNMHGTVM